MAMTSAMFVAILLANQMYMQNQEGFYLLLERRRHCYISETFHYSFVQFNIDVLVLVYCSI